MKFKELKSALFRDHYIVYCKLAGAVEQKDDSNTKTFNAVQITSGELKFYNEDDEIEEY